MEPNALPVPTRSADSGVARNARRGFTLLSPQFLDDLRSRVTLSSLVGRTVPLRKAGNEFKACCPFHQEKTPSFWVNDQKSFYHCFGCGAHGDAIRWLTDHQGLTFIEAVKELAAQTGLELPQPAPEEVARQEQTAWQQEIMEAATRYFEANLAGSVGASAQEYLDKRGFVIDTLVAFRLGYAPEGRRNLATALSKFTAKELVEVGLLISVEDKESYDRFRNRVMVPIRDPRGRVIAFGGRILGEGEPKYLNSPDTALFDKGRILFNLDRAAPASRQSDRIIVVEGYFDVIALDQSGIREAVAPMGTALTESQLEQLWRLTDEPILCFDGDSAGRKAAERASYRAMPNLRPGKQLKIAVLPDGKDPDDLIREGGRDKFERAIKTAIPLASFLYATELQKIEPARPEQRAALRSSLDELAKTCSDKFVAQEFGRSFTSLFFEDFGWKAKQRREIFKSAVRTSPRVSPDLARLYVRSALYGLTRFPAVAAAHLEAVSAIQIVHPDLRRWRDAISETVIQNPAVFDDGIKAVMEAELLPQTLVFDIRRDLRFGFTKSKTPTDIATSQLEALIEFLSQENAMNEQIRELDERAVRDSDGNAYEAIETARQQVREARASLLEAGVNWDAALQDA